MAVTRELNLFTADLCNFACKHCIANADAKASKYRLSRSEVEALANSINVDENVEQIHFVGGEPSLQLGMIEYLQNLVRRPVKYAMTTNGWFSRNPDRVLSRIKLDEIRISYDEYHAPFITTDQIRSLLKHCVSLGLRTALKLTVKNTADIFNNKDLLSPGVQLQLSQFEFAGKARELSKEQQLSVDFWNNRCPSFRDAELTSEAAVFFPGKGFSPCCSNLVFNESNADSLMFSKSLEEYWESNKLRSIVSNSFKSIAEEHALDVSNVRTNSACETCELLLGRIEYAGLPSITDIAKQARAGSFISPIKAVLSPSHLKMLSKNFRVYYQLVGNSLSSQRNEIVDLAVEGIRLSEHDALDSDLLVRLEAELMESSAAPSTAAERIKASAAIESYVRNCTHRLVYSQDGRAIAGLYVWDGLFHPHLQKTVTHVGLLGIHRSVTDKRLRRKIKSALKSQIEKIARGKNIVGKISAFNEPSLRNAESMGRSPVMICVEKVER